MCVWLPGTGKGRNAAAPVLVDGKKFRTLRGPTIATEFKALVIDYIDHAERAGPSRPLLNNGRSDRRPHPGSAGGAADNSLGEQARPTLSPHGWR